jgi:hypothetical protein
MPRRQRSLRDRRLAWLFRHRDLQAVLEALIWINNNADEYFRGQWWDDSRSNWFRNRGLFAVDQFNSFAEFEEAAWPSAKRTLRAAPRDLRPLGKEYPLPRLTLVPQLSEEERIEEDERREALEEQVWTVLRDIPSRSRDLLLRLHYDQSSLRAIGEQEGCTYQAVQQQRDTGYRDYRLRSEAGESLLGAREIARICHCTPSLGEEGCGAEGDTPAFLAPALALDWCPGGSHH